MANYHTWHHPSLDGKPAFSTEEIPVAVLLDDPLAPTNGASEPRQLASLMNDMDELRRIGQGKGICDAQRDVGKSFEDKEMWLLKVGKGTDHKVLFTGCHHAREWISVEVPFLVARYLIENYEDKPTDPKKIRIKHLVDNRQIWFVPITNPDGHQFSQSDDRWWRANRRGVVMKKQKLKVKKLEGGSRTIDIEANTYKGVDINRNYPESRWGMETSSTTRDPRKAGKNSTWSGPEAGSEPETQRIVKLFDDNAFRANLTFHNASQLLLYADDSARDPFAQFVGKGMSALIDEKGNPYLYESSADLYPTTGTQSTFAYERTKRPSFTPELRPNDDHREWWFSALPESEIDPCFREMLPACLALINCAGLDQVAGKTKVTVAASDPLAQVVPNGWKVFQGWEP
jgi:carboxypeptidase T